MSSIIYFRYVVALSDCTEEMEVYYGNQLEIFPMKRAMVLEFSPLLGPSDTQILWRPGQTSRRWSADVVTSDQQGNYTLRGRLGVELRKIRVTVIGTQTGKTSWRDYVKGQRMDKKRETDVVRESERERALNSLAHKYIMNKSRKRKKGMILL